MSALLPHGADEPAWTEAVLSYWFTELGAPQWFAKNDEVDATIRERFGALHERLASDDASINSAAPRELLAAIIVLDQFSRNLHRGSARAFATDPIALGLARTAIDNALDQQMAMRERIFVYLPFEHSEDPADQARSVALIATLGDAELERYAIAHKVVIDRFGRFPHRNVALERQSTPEETEFLKGPNSSF